MREPEKKVARRVFAGGGEVIGGLSLVANEEHRAMMRAAR